MNADIRCNVRYLVLKIFFCIRSTHKLNYFITCSKNLNKLIFPYVQWLSSLCCYQMCTLHIFNISEISFYISLKLYSWTSSAPSARRARSRPNNYINCLALVWHRPFDLRVHSFSETLSSNEVFFCLWILASTEFLK